MDASFMRLALGLTRRGYGTTSPNPVVGAIIVKGRKVIGRGWTQPAGQAHAEIQALRDAQAKGNNPRGATLYVTLEPCSTHGRTPPCTEAIKAAGIKQVVVAATDPNPKHSGKGFAILKRAGIKVTHGILAEEANRLNEAFNHWIVRRTPFVTVKSAMTLDGKIATANGESKWITGERARAYGMKLRQGADAVLVGINTVLADDPALTVRGGQSSRFIRLRQGYGGQEVQKRRIILDSLARTPLKTKVVRDEFRALTTVVVSQAAPKNRVAKLAERINVMIAPMKKSKDSAQPAIDLPWLMEELGAENVTSLLVEGGGEVNASFLLGGLAHRIAFFYAPKILGGRTARKGVAGAGVQKISEMIKLRDVEYQWLGEDLLMLGKLDGGGGK